MWYAGVLLAFVLCMFSARVQQAMRPALHERPARMFAAPLLLSAFFCAAAASYGALSLTLAVMVAVYSSLPTLCAYFQAGRPARPTPLDLIAILLLWLPLEFGVGAAEVPRSAQPALHTVAYGIAVSLALILFLLCRRYDGMKYNLPRSRSDYRNALVGFAIAAAVLIPVGLAVGFLMPWHRVRYSAVTVVTRIPLILVATALPEEILFRSIIQNWIVQRLGASTWTIAMAAVVFGCAHLNNAPGPLPNWRYAIVAGISGFIFGQVFHRSTSVIASALVHTGVNTVKWLFF